MKRIILAAAITLLAGVSPGLAQSPAQDTPAAYAQATQAADIFLWAWASCDDGLGLRLVSSGLLEQMKHDRSRGEVWLREYFSGMSNPHHLAFEITGGKLVSETHASFSVTLFEHVQGEAKAQRYDSTLELVREPAGPDSVLQRRVSRLTEPLEWKVSVLPQTMERR